jgi:hypothetical protein
MSQTTQPEIFYSQKNKLHNKYVEQLDKTMAEYPSYKLDETSKYSEELSTLNGITAEIDTLISTVSDRTRTANNIIEQGDDDLQQLKNVESNLSNYTSYEELDITSKQLLSDATQDYAKYKLIFYIKGTLVLLLLYKLIKTSKLKYVIALTIVLYCIVNIYLYFTNSFSEV